MNLPSLVTKALSWRPRRRERVIDATVSDPESAAQMVRRLIGSGKLPKRVDFGPDLTWLVYDGVMVSAWVGPLPGVTISSLSGDRDRFWIDDAALAAEVAAYGLTAHRKIETSISAESSAIKALSSVLNEPPL